MLQKTPTAETPKQGRSLLPTRRGFLIGAGASLGLVVGFALWPRSYRNSWTAGDGETIFNSWVKIGADGRVTIAIPQAEMGQGIYSGMAQIVADELGADWAMVGVEPAPLHPAYAHVGLAKAGAGALPPIVRDVAAYVGANVIQRLNLQLTGGSTSVKGYHDSLREAGATARGFLVAAAAREWKVSADALDTRDGAVFYKANRMLFADAVKLVDMEAAPANVELREQAARPLAGKPLLRLDIPPKVDGSARFGADVRLPGMLYAAIRHGPVGGKLVKVDVPEGQVVVKGDNWVAATGATSWEAMRAVSAIGASYEVRGKPAGPWIAEALAAAAAGNGGEAVAEDGDVDAALTGKTVTADYALPYLAHACIEPMVATARVADGKVEVWGPTQSLTLATWAVARALAVEDEAVTIYPTLLGGGFGRKAEADAMVQAALVARQIGKPVQLVWTREQDMANDMYRPPVAARFRASLTAERGIAAWDARIAVPSAGFSFMSRNMPRFAPSKDSPNGNAIEGANEIPYAVGAFRATHVPVLQPVPLGYWRSVGHSFSAFLVESFVDELAAEAGADPLAFRLGLLTAHPRHVAVLKAAAELGQWGDAAPAGFGRGIAVHESFGSIVAMVIEAGVVDGAVRIARVSSAIDCGRAINPDSVKAQVEGGAIYGLSAALGEAVTFENGEAVQRNFDSYPVMRMADSPRFATRIVTSGEALGGVGEPGTPPAAPALANALFAATGRRARTLPLATFFAA